MLEKLLNVIKGEKKLSYNHWRYKLLHWCHNVKDPHNSHLPKFFYTHYCPLFHMTNIIALGLPLILLFKIFVRCCYRVAAGVVFVSAMISYCYEKTSELYKKLFPKKPKPVKKEVEKPELTEEQLKKLDEELRLQDLKKLPNIIFYYLTSDVLNPITWINNSSFEKFWEMSKHAGCFKKITEEDAEQIFIKYKEEILAAKLLAEARKEQLRKNIVFWVNFSRIFIKGILNVLYGVLFVAALYLAVFYVAPTLYYVVSSLLNFGWMNLLTTIWFGLRIIFLIALALIAGLAVTGVFIRYICYPVLQPVFGFIGEIFSALGTKISSVTTHVFEFIEMFYEENCPPITIVEETEAKIAALGDEK